MDQDQIGKANFQKNIENLDEFTLHNSEGIDFPTFELLYWLFSTFASLNFNLNTLDLCSRFH